MPEPARDDPFIRIEWELEACLELIDAAELGRRRGLHWWVITELPSVLHWPPEYIGLGNDRVSIGSNGLTQIMPGIEVSVAPDAVAATRRAVAAAERPGSARPRTGAFACLNLVLDSPLKDCHHDRSPRT
ncbi:hypothetical protein [Nocardia asteroides]|uniref:hypothetical protein n=1 Tax=Nocardia asteroides TaxID=1824 RepID=UPI003F57B142